MGNGKVSFFIIKLLLFCSLYSNAQMNKMWDNRAQSNDEKTAWFRNAKFGLFVHWGLYSSLQGQYDGKTYYGISEWIQARAKVPAADYARLAENFNPTGFDANEWANFAQQVGVKYMVVTAKHHEGFAMFDSKVSDFNIAKATPFKRDPMKELSVALQDKGVKLGFYYSQYQDWHEPKGGGSEWEFRDKGPLAEYYRDKAIPQIKELMSNYGPLGLIWFDTPGGQKPEETKAMLDELSKIQPGCLYSSRVGNGLGDYRDFGDGEVPETIVDGAWEAIFTHNDSWGYTPKDMNFKTPKELIHLLATVVSRGGNLMVNVGPDDKGRIPETSVKYFLEVGKWLKANGTSIYETTYGQIPPQPWGVTTAKPGKLFLHVLNRPLNSQIVVPGFSARVKAIRLHEGGRSLKFKQNDTEINIDLPAQTAKYDQVVEVDYEGALENKYGKLPIMISSNYPEIVLEPAMGKKEGNTRVGNQLHANYFGDWKHTACVSNQSSPEDKIVFVTRIAEPGDYKITLEYSCIDSQAGQEGVLMVNDQRFQFQTLATQTSLDVWKPMLFVDQNIAILKVTQTGEYVFTLAPLHDGMELIKLKGIKVIPVKME